MKRLWNQAKKPPTPIHMLTRPSAHVDNLYCTAMGETMTVGAIRVTSQGKPWETIWNTKINPATGKAMCTITYTGHPAFSKPSGKPISLPQP